MGYEADIICLVFFIFFLHNLVNQKSSKSLHSSLPLWYRYQKSTRYLLKQANKQKKEEKDKKEEKKEKRKENTRTNNEVCANLKFCQQH